MKIWHALAALGVIAILMGVSYWIIWWGSRTTALSKDWDTQGALADVKVMLKRRFDLIPNLANATRAGFNQEQTVQVGSAEARSKQLSGELTGAVTPDEIDKIASESSKISDNLIITVRAVTEAYPELKSDKVVLAYMDELAGTENRISTARIRYNAVAEDFNTYITTDFWYITFWQDKGLVKERPLFDIKVGEENLPPLAI